MSMSRSDEQKVSILVFVEDPGALNGLLPMARRLASAGHNVHVEFDGFARSAKGLDLRGFTLATGSLENISTKKYDVLLVGTSENVNSIAFELIEKCKNFGIMTYAFIDSPANPSNRFSAGGSDPLKFAPDFLIVLDQKTARIFEHLGFSREGILVTEHPHLEWLHSQKLKFSEQSSSDIRALTFGENYRNQTLITFCSELSSGLDNEGYKRTDEYLLESPDTIVNRSDIVMYNFLEALDQLKHDGLSFKSILRLHPKQLAEDSPLRNRFDVISQGGDAFKVCMASSVIVGMTSMVLVEAVELDVPVISLLPRSKEVEWMHTSIREKVPICFNFEEFLITIRRVLNAKNGSDNPNDRVIYNNLSQDYVDFIVGGKGTRAL